jgi:hypothetical protein
VDKSIGCSIVTKYSGYNLITQHEQQDKHDRPLHQHQGARHHIILLGIDGIYETLCIFRLDDLVDDVLEVGL